MIPKLTEDEKFEQVTSVLSKRFSTHGFHRVRTPAFERYDLYSKVTSSVHRKEMVKIVDPTGDVLVLRPDVTIPITQELSHFETKLTSEHRFYYIEEVYRRSSDPTEKIERTQSGIEYFCERSPDVDAETILLALQTMKDLKFQDIKIEIGHTAFFQEMIDMLPMSESQLHQLKALIQAKNSVEIASLLENVSADPQMKNAIMQIPNLYGKPDEVLRRAKEISTTFRMEETLSYVGEVYQELSVHGIEKQIVIDFGLINRMDYYSGILFQGYVGYFGKPVLMGGRYDRLGYEFGADLPAIGFACEIESLLKASDNQKLFKGQEEDERWIE
jgi:ATP phosphoribosyltransferase regulatory subunit